MKDNLNVAGIGELLWDIFPKGKRLGGAPANFAFHGNMLGGNAWAVSCVGADPLGRSLCENLDDMGVRTEFVFESEDYPTGTVDVVLDDGKPSYEIHKDVAWDHIPFTASLRQFAGTLDAVCFGSLSQRSGKSRGTIRSFLKYVPAEALKIYDVNLRQSFYSKRLIEDSLGYATVLKLSDEELPVLSGFFGLEGSDRVRLEALRDRFDLELIAYTRGPEGSLLLGKTERDDFAGCDGLAVDSVGAGDSFTASLCMGLLRGWPLSRVNQFANEVATFVCSQNGATPVLPEHLVNFSR